MIESKTDLRFYLQEDKKRNLGTERVGLLRFLVECIYGTDRIKAFRLLKALRYTEYAKNVLFKRGLAGKVVYTMCQWRYHRLEVRYNIAIGVNMVGYGFRLPHVVGGGIIINCNKMGCYCGANAGVVVGNNHSWNDRPTIGNNVKLTVGCKVIGGIHLGDNVIVAPNSVVIKDVPDDCIVSGVPATIIKKING